MTGWQIVPDIGRHWVIHSTNPEGSAIDVGHAKFVEIKLTGSEAGCNLYKIRNWAIRSMMHSPVTSCMMHAMSQSCTQADVNDVVLMVFPIDPWLISSRSPHVGMLLA